MMFGIRRVPDSHCGLRTLALLAIFSLVCVQAVAVVRCALVRELPRLLSRHILCGSRARLALPDCGRRCFLSQLPCFSVFFFISPARRFGVPFIHSFLHSSSTRDSAVYSCSYNLDLPFNKVKTLTESFLLDTNSEVSWQRLGKSSLEDKNKIARLFDCEDSLPFPGFTKMSTLNMSMSIFLLAMCIAVGYGQPLRVPNPRSCGEASMCCQGQNNTCFVLGMRVDRSEDSKRCYCDSNCLIMGDCCMDYHHHCRSVDCIVGTWTEWTECNNACGYGTRRRIRPVTTQPDNGGHHCPVLKQRRACVGYDTEICRQQSLEEQTEELAEKARILPLQFGEWRADKKWNPWKGILKNLYHDYYNQIFTRPTYRTKFIVKSAHYGCAKSEWANVLKVNTTICVECQPIAMNREIGMRCMGHGVFGRDTAWKAVDVSHCHGFWEQTEGNKPEVCDLVDEKNFLFI